MEVFLIPSLPDFKNLQILRCLNFFNDFREKINPALTSRGACPESLDNNHGPRDDPWLAVAPVEVGAGRTWGAWHPAQGPGWPLERPSSRLPHCWSPWLQGPRVVQPALGLSPEAQEAAPGHAAICPLSPQRQHLRAVPSCNPIRDRTRTWGTKTRDIVISGFPRAARAPDSS